MWNNNDMSKAAITRAVAEGMILLVTVAMQMDMILSVTAEMEMTVGMIFKEIRSVKFSLVRRGDYVFAASANDNLVSF